jgi:Raf kinase inhibitor-like YbhB/YbcL family protein
MNRIAAAATLVAALATSAAAQDPPLAVEDGAANLALVLAPAKGGAKLTVTTQGWKPGGDIPKIFTQYGTNTFPGLAWTAGPAGTKSYAIVMQDGDGRNGIPFMHWIAGNFPPTVTKLDSAMTTLPAGAANGGRGGRGYNGPRTPAGPKHRYHIQVFALDIVLPPEALANLTTITAAMKDHVLASGEVIGLGQFYPPGTR